MCLEPICQHCVHQHRHLKPFKSPHFDMIKRSQKLTIWEWDFSKMCNPIPLFYKRNTEAQRGDELTHSRSNSNWLADPGPTPMSSLPSTKHPPSLSSFFTIHKIFSHWFLLCCWFFLTSYCSIIALQCCVSFCCITKWISYMYTYILISLPSCVSLPLSLSHPSRWSQIMDWSPCAMQLLPTSYLFYIW